MINPLSSFAPLVDARAPQRASDPKKTAAEFEVLLVKQLLDELPMPGLEDTEAGTFLSLVHEALARQIVEQGGLGLVGQLDRAAPPFRPGHPRVSSGYGLRRDPIDGALRHHRGLDLPAPQGAEVAAARAGRVSFAGDHGGYGNLIVVDHEGGLQTAYAHCETISVSEGQHVDAGTLLGTVGSTGRSTGPHLHFEVRRDGAAVDPSLAGIEPWQVLNGSSAVQAGVQVSAGSAQSRFDR